MSSDVKLVKKEITGQTQTLNGAESQGVIKRSRFSKIDPNSLGLSPHSTFSNACTNWNDSFCSQDPNPKDEIVIHRVFQDVSFANPNFENKGLEVITESIQEVDTQRNEFMAYKDMRVDNSNAKSDQNSISVILK